MDVAKITSAVEHYDEIVAWQQRLVSAAGEEEFYEIAAGLVRVYGALAQQGVFGAPSKQGRRVASWLREQLSDFWDIVVAALARHAAVAGAVALKIVLLRGKYAGLPIDAECEALLAAAVRDAALWARVQPEFVRYDDLRFRLLAFIPARVGAAATGGAAGAGLEERAQLRLLVPALCGVEKTVRVDGDLGAIYATREGLPFAEKQAALRYRQAWQRAWLHVLRLPLAEAETKQVLTVMHTRVIPNFAKPQLLMDYLVDAYEWGGSVSLLALNALFVLIQEHRLDYPQFFTKLYELLEDGSLLASAHRARFLRLLDLFLTSTHLPATIPASIVKRLARLCLFAPPGAIVAILPFVYNQLKRHPTCMVMIHRPAGAPGADPFDNEERDPLLTRALDSSLWELQTLAAHFHPNVAAIARIFSQPFRKPQFQLEHFLAHSYDTLYLTEHHRKRDREPGLEFEFHDALADLGASWSL